MKAASLIETGKINGVEPFVTSRLARGHPQASLNDLLRGTSDSEAEQSVTLKIAIELTTDPVAPENLIGWPFIGTVQCTQHLAENRAS